MVFKVHGAAAWLRLTIIATYASWALCSCSGLSVSDPIKAPEWPQWLGPNRDGISTEAAWTTDWPEEGPTVLWKASLGEGPAAVSVKDGRLFTMGYVDGSDVVYCLDSETGEEKWRYAYPCAKFDQAHDGGPSCTPSIDGNRVYTLSREALVHCFDAATSEIVWSKDMRERLEQDLPAYGVTGSPLVEGDRVIIEAGRTFALDKMTGDVIWESEEFVAGYSSPITFDFGERCRVAVFNQFGLFIFDVESGEEIFRDEWKKVNHCVTPVIQGDRMFLTAYYGDGCRLYKLDPAGIEKLYENDNMKSVYAQPMVLDGYLYGFDFETLKCIELETSETVWEKEGFKFGLLSMADGKLLIMSDQSELIIAEATPEEFREIANAQVLGGLCVTMPTLCNGLLYLRNGKGEMVCLDVRAP